MKHTRVPKRVSFNINYVEIMELASVKLVAKGLANHHAKAYEFSHFVTDAKPTALLTHGMKLVGYGMRGLAILISNICSNYRKNPWLKASQSSRKPLEFARAVWLENTLSTSSIGGRKTELHAYWG